MKTHDQSVLLTIACLLMLSGCTLPQRPGPTPILAAQETVSALPSLVEPTVTANPTLLTLTPTLSQRAPTSQPTYQTPQKQVQPVSAPSATALSTSTATPTPCSQPWLVEDPPTVYCPSVTTETEAAAQRFEHGIMVWLKDPGIYLIALDAKVVPEWRQTWVNDPLTIYRDTSADYTPASGLYAPQSGFGLVWRGDVSPDGRGYQDLLGWALAPEVGYRGVMQTAYFSADRYVRYASTPFGVKLTFLQSLQTWFVGDA